MIACPIYLPYPSTCLRRVHAVNLHYLEVVILCPLPSDRADNLNTAHIFLSQLASRLCLEDLHLASWSFFDVCGLLKETLLFKSSTSNKILPVYCRTMVLSIGPDLSFTNMSATTTPQGRPTPQGARTLKTFS